MKFTLSLTVVAGCAVFLYQGLDAPLSAEEETKTKEPIIGMYVHQHWSYNHPYAARTWTQVDWKGYLDGLSKIGYNSVLIWPVLETMPDPLTPSDEESLAKIASVVDFAHRELHMRVFIALCPNVVAKDEEARKYTFQERPFFYCDKRINPADAVEMGKMIAWRKKLFEPLKEVDGVFIIDSDPGGYPGSNNLEFVYLLNAHRTMFNQLNPGIELYYWIHAGWEAFCRFYETAEFRMGEMPEILDAVQLLAKVNPEPWGLTSGRGIHIVDDLGLADRVLAYSYGAIEGEPSFPMTNFNTKHAYRAGKEIGPRGTMGNSQTHCVQLPNAFLFAQGALQQPMPEHSEYVEFANRLLPGHGEVIVSAWEAMDGIDAQRIRDALKSVEPLMNTELKTGDLHGLLFGDPKRFINDLVLMLRTRAALEEFHAAAMEKPDSKDTGEKMSSFVEAISAWQTQHGYKNNLYLSRMQEPLMKVDPEFYKGLLSELSYKGEGATPFEKIQNGYKKVETFTPRLIDAMRKTADQLIRNGK